MNHRTSRNIWLAVIPALCLIVALTGITVAAPGKKNEALAGVLAGPAGIWRSFSRIPGGSPITFTRPAIGEYELDFGDPATVGNAMSQAYFQATKGGHLGPGFASVEWGGTFAPNKVTVRTYDASGAPVDSNFFLTVH